MTQVSKRPPPTPRQAAGRRTAIDRLLDPVVFRALADPTRALLLACLMKCGRPCSVSEIAECCTVDLSVVSRHLQLLERSGLLSVEKRGRIVKYTVRFHELKQRLLALAAAVDECCPAAGGCCDGGTCGSGQSPVRSERTAACGSTPAPARNDAFPDLPSSMKRKETP